MRQKIAAGNWKMNGTTPALDELRTLCTEAPEGPEIILCPPATLIAAAAQIAQGSRVQIGAQTCHPAPSGAHTGDLSAPMLADAGATHVILGHSERRADHGETDADVLAQVQAAQAAGLRPIVCAGETLEERQNGDEIQIVTQELLNSLPPNTGPEMIVAYEPIWAIGTGATASPQDIETMHSAIRSALRDRFGEETADSIRILYGGSVKPSNAAQIFATPDVDGALVGGASLKAADFSQIIAAL